ncbi:hypothetical protein D3C80_2019480 [compost metagenome]
MVVTGKVGIVITEVAIPIVVGAVVGQTAPLRIVFVLDPGLGQITPAGEPPLR